MSRARALINFLASSLRRHLGSAFPLHVAPRPNTTQDVGHRRRTQEGTRRGQAQARAAPRAAQGGASRRRPAASRTPTRFLARGFAHSPPILSRSQRLGARVKNIRELVRDVVGSAPYEKRLMELLKVGRDKRALKLAKRKVRRPPDSRFFLGFVVFADPHIGDPSSDPHAPSRRSPPPEHSSAPTVAARRSARRWATCSGSCRARRITDRNAGEGLSTARVRGSVGRD